MSAAATKYPPFIPGSYEPKPVTRIQPAPLELCTLAQLPAIIEKHHLWPRKPAPGTIAKLRANGFIALRRLPGCRPLVDVQTTLQRLRSNLTPKN